MLQQPLFQPASNWKLPHELPNLSHCKRIGLDFETCDPKIKELGPGFIRGDARVVGAAISTDDTAWYLPFAHLGSQNLSPEVVKRFIQDIVSDRSRWIIGANLQYELECMWSLGITCNSKLVDVQLAEPLLDEESERGYSLEVLCQKYLGRGKDESLLNEAAAAYGVDPKGGLWKLPPKYVGPYAEFDALSCMQILPKQLANLKEEDLLGIFELESKLLPILWEMRKNGIPIDVDGAKKFSADLAERENIIRERVNREYGCRIDEWSGPMLASLCDHNKIFYPRTPKGNPSFTGDFLDGADHPLLKSVSEIRTLNRLRGTFINDWILKYEVNGRVHPQWKQVARDDGGTRSGRMAASNPNPQQVPARSELAPLLRALFRSIPPEKWAKLDYSQQEPRLLIHYASIMELSGIEPIRDAYQKNPKMDIYTFLSESVGMSRRDAKDATLGRMYGMGAPKFAMKQNITVDVAKKKLEEFDAQVPFVRELSELCMNLAQKRGWIKTLLGRRRHFNLWEPAQRGDGRWTSYPLKTAQQAYPGKQLQRAWTYKALNALIQGSAADMTKAAMVKIYEEDGKVPFMAVHDELNYGVSSEDEARHLQKKCETCVTLDVPVRADLSFGDHWK